MSARWSPLVAPICRRNWEGDGGGSWTTLKAGAVGAARLPRLRGHLGARPQSCRPAWGRQRLRGVGASPEDLLGGGKQDLPGSAGSDTFSGRPSAPVACAKVLVDVLSVTVTQRHRSARGKRVRRLDVHREYSHSLFSKTVALTGAWPGQLARDSVGARTLAVRRAAGRPVQCLRFEDWSPSALACLVVAFNAWRGQKWCPGRRPICPVAVRDGWRAVAHRAVRRRHGIPRAVAG